jgi:hypothetical protein
VIQALGLVLRFLIVLFFVRLGLRFLAAIVRGGSEAPPASTRPSVDELVRDRVCNTFLPRERALFAQVQGQPAWFCSEGCRDRALLR